MFANSIMNILTLLPKLLFVLFVAAITLFIALVFFFNIILICEKIKPTKPNTVRHEFTAMLNEPLEVLCTMFWRGITRFYVRTRNQNIK